MSYIYKEENDMNLIEKGIDQTFFSPGDVVVLKQALTNRPVMMVNSVDRTSDPTGKLKLLGLTCLWFNTNHELQTARFNTKDLMPYDGDED